MVKYSEHNLGGVPVIKRERDDGIVDYIGIDETNPDYIEYLATIAPAPTLEDEIDALQATLADKRMELAKLQLRADVEATVRAETAKVEKPARK